MSYDVYFAVSGEEHNKIASGGLRSGYPLRQFDGRFTTMFMANQDAQRLAERTGEALVLKVTVSGHYKRSITFYDMNSCKTVPAAGPIYDPNHLEGSL